MFEYLTLTSTSPSSSSPSMSSRSPSPRRSRSRSGSRSGSRSPEPVPEAEVRVESLRRWPDMSRGRWSHRPLKMCPRPIFSAQLLKGHKGADSQACPFLVRLYVTKGKHTPLIEFDDGKFPLADEFQVHGWWVGCRSRLTQQETLYTDVSHPAALLRLSANVPISTRALRLQARVRRRQRPRTVSCQRSRHFLGP